MKTKIIFIILFLITAHIELSYAIKLSDLEKNPLLSCNPERVNKYTSDTKIAFAFYWCNYFYFQGNLYILENRRYFCSPGLWWNATTEKCDWPSEKIGLSSWCIFWEDVIEV